MSLKMKICLCIHVMELNTNIVKQLNLYLQRTDIILCVASHSVPEYEDEIAPYATFQLPPPPGEEDIGETEEFKTFSVHHGEPPYLTKVRNCLIF